MSAWVRLLRAHAATTRAFNAELLNEHGLTINDFEALLRLSRAEEGRMRRVDLAENLLLTASGVTRLLDGLESHGLVERAACSSDRRVVYAVITEAGRTRLQAASESHIASVTELFEQRFGDEELDRLAELLGRLPGADESASEDCSP
ncbi:MAG TPA: MarR family transcriptional regulator [Gaiellaceae bacterium]|jgi:DNA-binding MarR family transcriptional regulator|nr:MarR family transcriptional regulator [Gaiellaceae bacterium]